MRHFALPPFGSTSVLFRLTGLLVCVVSWWPLVALGQPVPTAPSPGPDRVILTWSSDPATTAAVTWRTATSVTQGVAQIAEAEDGPLFVAKAKQLPARSEELPMDMLFIAPPEAGKKPAVPPPHVPARFHSVEFQGLKPDTQYVYRVGDGTHWSEWNQFRTAAAGAAPLEFLYVGDAQNDLFSLWSRLIRQGILEAPKARFILHAGDLVNRGTSDSDWAEWSAAAGWINRSIFSIPVPGNHEYFQRPDKQRQLTSHWRRQFTLPGNGLPGLEESNYYLDIQGVRVVALNSNERQAEQAAWLDKLLSNNPNRWTLVTFHHPIFSTARGRDNKELRELWQPVFDKHRVDLVMTGHDHTYGRSNVLSGVSGMRGGTVYVVSVSGPKMYNLERQKWMQRAAEDTQLFQILRISGDRLVYEARTARGRIYDAFTLEKRRNGPNRLRNQKPVLPENLRPPEKPKVQP